MYMKGGILNITNDSFLENIAVQVRNYDCCVESIYESFGQCM